MRSDFGQSCKFARAAIPVSAVPLARIRVAAAAPSFGSTHRRLLLGAMTGTLSVTLLAATAIVRLSGVHISFTPSGSMALQFLGSQTPSRFVDHPTAADLRKAAVAADFPVRFPTGLPADAPLRQMFRAGTSVIMLQYDLPGAWRRSDHQLWIMLANPKAVGGPITAKTVGHVLFVGPSGKGRLRWQAGGETVIVLRSNALPTELASIKRSMLAQAR